ncbi:hypothetical protein [Lewinella sp. JB7]|uniref:hypothetical protein n=1 Tax=Lewinella sp. JB7 TaxID=2962887 RepID=UPI0020CA15CE|nr:hypothetical protein [Lewinella sp. JB7]MCP9237965.1 hypothetical protein [Lewinella sp. JB7]
MKNLSILIFFIIAPTICYTQVSEEEVRELQDAILEFESFKNQTLDNIEVIEQRNIELTKKLININFAAFRQMENSIRTAFDETDVISASATYQQAIKNIILLHTEITSVNNFTDAENVFGLDFKGQILNIAEGSLIDQIKTVFDNEPVLYVNERKSKFRNIVKSILDNPIISGLVKSNPITSVAHSIINQVVSADATKITDISLTRVDYSMPNDFGDFKRNYPAFKQSYESSNIVGGVPHSQSIIDPDAITQFSKDLKPMIKVFDELSAINDEFESSLDVFMQASEETIERAKPVESKFYEKLGVANRDAARNSIRDFFNVGATPSLELLEAKLIDNTMNEVLSYTDEVSEVSLLLKNDFLKVLRIEIELSDAYIKFFKKLKAGGDGLPHFDDVSTLDERIEQFEEIKESLVKQHNQLSS